MKPSPKTVYIALAILLASPIATSSDEPTVVMTAVHEYKLPISSEEYTRERPAAPTTFKLNIWCYIKNAGNDNIRVATAFTGSFLALGGKLNKVELAISSREGPLEIIVIPSESELKIVTLRPGESALVEWEHIGARRLNKVDQLTVTLRTDPVIASRFGLWGGTVSVDSTPVRSGK